MTEAVEYTVPEVIDRIGLGTFQYRMMMVTGVLWMGDALEVMMLSLIGQNLKCDWGISDMQEASLSTLIFAGMGIGSPSFGFLGDKFGRKTSCVIGSFFSGVLWIYVSCSSKLHDARHPTVFCWF